MGCAAYTLGTLVRGVGGHMGALLADVPPHKMVTALGVAKRQCPALRVRSASEDEKFPPNFLIHSACRYAHGN